MDPDLKISRADLSQVPKFFEQLKSTPRRSAIAAISMVTGAVATRIFWTGGEFRMWLLIALWICLAGGLGAASVAGFRRTR